MRVALITEAAMAKTHGVGAQLIRVFAEGGIPFEHFYYRREQFGASECEGSHYLGEPPWPFRRGSQWSERMRQRLGLSLWQGDEVRTEPFRRYVERSVRPCDVAYVNVGRENDAARALSLVKALGVPYVLHVVDLLHEDGLDPATMPGFAELIAGAGSVLALTDTIRDELLKFGPRRIGACLVGQNARANVAAPPARGEPVRVLTIGRPYYDGCEVLAEAKASGLVPDRYHLEYCGAHFHTLPAALQPHVHNHGHVSDAEYEELLPACHIAFLSGPLKPDCFARYSFPSRTVDYLMAGLPIVGCIGPGTPTESLLADVIPAAVRVARTPEALGAALSALGESVDAWCAASAAGRRFALERFSIDVVRRQIVEALEDLVRVRAA